MDTEEISKEENLTEEISFEDLGLDELALAAVAKKGFETPSPIQVLAIPRLLNGDANMIAKARTGTGKTAAFGLPLIQKVRGQSDSVRALILEPTRELAVQTCNELQSFTTQNKIELLYILKDRGILTIQEYYNEKGAVLKKLCVDKELCNS